jgi:hypothetical protein
MSVLTLADTGDSMLNAHLSIQSKNNIEGPSESFLFCPETPANFIADAESLMPGETSIVWQRTAKSIGAGSDRFICCD